MRIDLKLVRSFKLAIALGNLFHSCIVCGKKKIAVSLDSAINKLKSDITGSLAY